MKLYLNEFVDKEIVDLEFVLAPAEVDSLLNDGEFRAVSDFRFDLRARRLGNAIRVSGDVKGVFEYECGRCLAIREHLIETEIELVYVSRDLLHSSYDDYSDEDGWELSNDDLDVASYEGDEIELDDELREVILLELPTYAVCPDSLREECEEGLQSLMAEAKLDGAQIKALEENSVDERWSALKNIKLMGSDSSKEQ